MRAKIDKFLNSWISKKLFVFIIASVFVAMHKITDSEWTNIALAYIGSQAAIDAVLALRGKRNVDNY